MNNTDSSRLKPAISVSIVFAISFLFLFLTMNRNINIYDEGIMLTAAMRVGAGDIPHRDFYAIYGPAEFYLLSWLFDIFGHKVIAERIFDLSVRSGILTIVYATLILTGRRLIAITITIVCALWLFSVGSYAYPIYPVILLSIISTVMMLHVLVRDTSIVFPFAAGMITGLAALFRYDLGFLLFVAHVSSAALIMSLSLSDAPLRIRYILQKLLPYVLAAGFPVGSILLWYYSVGALSSFAHDSFLFPIEFYSRTRGLPFPSFFKISNVKLGGIYLPIIICCAVLLSFRANDFRFKTCFQSSSTADISRKNYAAFLIIFTLLAAMFYIKGLVRVSLEHMQLALLPSLLILGVLLGKTINKARWFRAVLAGVAIFACATAFASASDYAKSEFRSNLVLSDVSGFFRLLSASDISPVDIEPSGWSIDP